MFKVLLHGQLTLLLGTCSMAEAKLTTHITNQGMKRHLVLFKITPQITTGPLQGPYMTLLPPFLMLPPWEEAFGFLREIEALKHNSGYIVSRSSLWKVTNFAMWF